MTSKRFSVLVISVGLDGAVASAPEPATLTLDTASSRSDTLALIVHSTRGRGAILMKAESFSEKRLNGTILGNSHGMRVLEACPRGYEVVQFQTDAADPSRVCHVFTVVADELLTGARELRRGKPKTPTPKMANDEIWQCAGCHVRTMARGSENLGWKHIQMSPHSADHVHYCGKPKCGELRDQAIEVAKVNWGYEDTSGAPPERQPPPDPEKAATESKYGPPADKPFL